MIIIGVDYHPSFQQIAFLDQETGECGDRRHHFHGVADSAPVGRDLSSLGALSPSRSVPKPKPQVTQIRSWRLSPRHPLALAFPPEYQVNEAFTMVMNLKELSQSCPANVSF